MIRAILALILLAGTSFGSHVVITPPAGYSIIETNTYNDAAGIDNGMRLARGESTICYHTLDHYPTYLADSNLIKPLFKSINGYGLFTNTWRVGDILAYKQFENQYVTVECWDGANITEAISGVKNE
jgi:hypothetical protein